MPGTRQLPTKYSAGSAKEREMPKFSEKGLTGDQSVVAELLKLIFQAPTISGGNNGSLRLDPFSRESRVANCPVTQAVQGGLGVLRFAGEGRSLGKGFQGHLGFL